MAFTFRNSGDKPDTIRRRITDAWLTRNALRNELHYRARAEPLKQATALDVTLACVDCGNQQDAAVALDLSRRGCRFARVLLLSHERPEIIPPWIDWVQIPELSMRGYQKFCLRDLWRYVFTSHVLTIETDGWILRPEQWDDAWLAYDYIGAPWPKTEWAVKTRVGNSGCCLRSRNLLMATSELATDVRSGTRQDSQHPGAPLQGRAGF